MLLEAPADRLGVFVIEPLEVLGEFGLGNLLMEPQLL
jgi:hypothetical protein